MSRRQLIINYKKKLSAIGEYECVGRNSRSLSNRAFLSESLNEQIYTIFLETELPCFIENTTSDTFKHVVYVPPHFNRTDSQYLNNAYGNIWIRRGQPVK